MHTLVRRNIGEGTGWYAPAELQSAAPTGLGFAVPVDSDGGFFSAYWVQVASISDRGDISLDAYRMIPRTSREFILDDFLPGEAVFVPRKTLPAHRFLKYKGRFRHHDFTHNLVELVPRKDEEFELFFAESRLVIVGCDPSNYNGFVALP
jgi:hypothetical protein